MGKIIAVVNQKGGVGKSTTCVNLTAALHARGYRTLLVDIDPQANSTSGMGVRKDRHPNSYEVLIGSSPAASAVIETRYGFILPSNRDLAAADVELVGQERREYRLREALTPLKEQYEYIFLDCPPSLELLTINALATADTVLIPVQCEYYALEGLADLINSIRLVKRGMNPALEIEGILITMFDNRTNFSNQVEQELRSHFGDKVYERVIPRNVRLAEAPSHGQPCIVYDRICKGTRAYLHFASEFLRHQQR